MNQKQVLIGRSTQTPIENKKRREVVVPGRPSQDFILTARCRIMKVGGRITISATDLPGDPGGTYAWDTDSDKLRLVNKTGSTLVVEALMMPSSARDGEIITVTRTGRDGGKKSKTISVTVAKISFKPSPRQNYGYDDYDTPLIQDDDHVSIKSNSETFIGVKIEGGALGTDFSFVPDDAKVCTVDAAPDKSEFDLRIQAKSWQKKATVLRAKMKCSASTVCAALNLNVYAEKVVKVLVAKVANNAFSATALIYPNADYAGHQTLANEKLKEGVVRFDLKNFTTDNSVVHVDFGKNIDGALIFDINSQGGLEFDLISASMNSNEPDQYRVAIIKKMRSYYYLDRPVRKGDTSISVRGNNVFKAIMPLGKGQSLENIDVISTSGNIATLAKPLNFDHASGEPLEFPAVAWSTDPIIITEDASTLDITKWTILHEVGHSALELQDIVDLTNFMNFHVGTTDNRLRYCPRESRYTPGVKENQWETIPRPLPKPPVK